MKNHEIFEEFCTWWKCERQGTMKDLARQLDVTTATLYYWLRPSKHNAEDGGGVPLRHVKKVEELSGNVFTRQRLRPDVFQTRQGD